MKSKFVIILFSLAFISFLAVSREPTTEQNFSIKKVTGKTEIQEYEFEIKNKKDDIQIPTAPTNLKNSLVPKREVASLDSLDNNKDLLPSFIIWPLILALPLIVWFLIMGRLKRKNKWSDQ